MCGLPTGTKTVAIVERWPLVEVRMYMFNKIIQMDNLKNCLCFSQNKILVVQDWMSQGIVCYPIQPNQNLEWTWHSSMIVFLDRGSHQNTGHYVVTIICLFSTWQPLKPTLNLALNNLYLLQFHLTEGNFAQFAKHREKWCSSPTCLKCG